MFSLFIVLFNTGTGRDLKMHLLWQLGKCSVAKHNVGQMCTIVRIHMQKSGCWDAAPYLSILQVWDSLSCQDTHFCNSNAVGWIFCLLSREVRQCPRIAIQENRKCCLAPSWFNARICQSSLGHPLKGQGALCFALCSKAVMMFRYAALLSQIYEFNKAWDCFF